MNHIGQDFSTYFTVNFLPHVNLPRGIYQSNYTYISIINGQTIMNHSSQNMIGRSSDLDVVVGRDVYSIEYRLHTHNSFPSGGLYHFSYKLRLDQLILLNLLVKLHPKLLKSP